MIRALAASVGAVAVVLVAAWALLILGCAWLLMRVIFPWDDALEILGAIIVAVVGGAIGVVRIARRSWSRLLEGD